MGLPMEVCWRGVVPMARVLRTYIPHRYPVVGREPNDSVDVIRHHDQFVDRGRPAIAAYGQQGQFYGPPGPLIVEDDRALMGADGDEIRSRAAVIERWRADGTPVVSSGIEPHSSGGLADRAANREGGDVTRGWRQAGVCVAEIGSASERGEACLCIHSGAADKPLRGGACSLSARILEVFHYLARLTKGRRLRKTVRPRTSKRP